MLVVADIPYYVTIISILAIAVSIVLFFVIKKHYIQNENLLFLGNIIQTGAMAFLKKEYSYLSILIIIGFISFPLIPFLGFNTGLTFVVGAFLPSLAGYIGMKTATTANVRTSSAANKQGEKAAFSTAFSGGIVTGLTTSALGILGVIAVLYIWDYSSNTAPLIGFALGSCILGLFSRVGGGIYTKGADVGADLVGKVEKNIPEDDPRNPAVIADNVGDNVGDTAGMGADIFGSYISAIIATILISYNLDSSNHDAIYYPIAIAGVGLASSLISMIIFKLFSGTPAAITLRFMPIIASGISTLLIIAMTHYFNLTGISLKMGNTGILITVITGIIGGILIGLVTEWYTSGEPTLSIAHSSKTGHGSNVIQGLAVGMESTLIPIIIICIIIFTAYFFTGDYGIGLASVSMLSTVGATIAVDAYGPISDNAGGIAEMAHLDSEVRDITDKLDALGNTTAAIGKGFSVASATLTSLALLSNFTQQLSKKLNVTVSISDPIAIIGLLLGGTVTFLFSSLTMKAVGSTAIAMVEEVRDQFKNIPGLMEGKAKPDYAKCVNIATAKSLKKMILPGLITIITPFILIIIFHNAAFKAIEGFAVGSLLTSVLMAIFMSTAGGAWDNAKKFIEAGKIEGHKKGDDVHKASVTGDTVGDPFKDTSGPSLNIVMKLVTTLALMLLPILV